MMATRAWREISSRTRPSEPFSSRTLSRPSLTTTAGDVAACLAAATAERDPGASTGRRSPGAAKTGDAVMHRAQTHAAGRWDRRLDMSTLSGSGHPDRTHFPFNVRAVIRHGGSARVNPPFALGPTS